MTALKVHRDYVKANIIDQGLLACGLLRGVWKSKQKGPA